MSFFSYRRVVCLRVRQFDCRQSQVHLPRPPVPHPQERGLRQLPLLRSRRKLEPRHRPTRRPIRDAGHSPRVHPGQVVGLLSRVDMSRLHPALRVQLVHGQQRLRGQTRRILLPVCPRTSRRHRFRRLPDVEDDRDVGAQ